MCPIALSKSSERRKRKQYSSDSSDSSEKNHTTSPQKNHATFIFYFLSTSGKVNLTHLTNYVMFSGQRFATLTMFLLRGCVIYCMKRLHNFLCEEVAWLFVWRGFLIKKNFCWKLFFLVGKKIREFFLVKFFGGEIFFAIFFCNFLKVVLVITFTTVTTLTTVTTVTNVTNDTTVSTVQSCLVTTVTSGITVTTATTVTTVPTVTTVT